MPDLGFEPPESKQREIELAPREAPLDEGRKLGFAKGCLGVLAGMFTLAAVGDYFNPDHGADIFDAAQKALPPIATFILGYYFSSRRG